MWEEVCTKCLATLKVFLEGLNKANKELTSHTPSFLSKFVMFVQNHPFVLINNDHSVSFL